MDSDKVNEIIVDDSGNLILTGSTKSADFPTTPGSYDTLFNDRPVDVRSDGFISKINADGNALLYSSFIGGSKMDECTGVCVDSTGKLFLVGHTESIDFPTISGSYDTSFNYTIVDIQPDIFICRLD